MLAALAHSLDDIAVDRRSEARLASAQKRIAELERENARLRGAEQPLKSKPLPK